MSFHLATRKVIKEWTDYNEHMNMAYYVLIFDQAWETMLNKFHMGGSNAQINKRSTMVVDTRTTYDNEVKENDEVDVYCTFFDHDKKRLHLKCEMYEKKSKKVTEFEQDKIQIMDDFINKNKVSFNSENLVFSGKLKK